MADKKTRSEAALLVLVVFLLGAIAGGTANHLWGERVWGKQPAVGQPSRDQIVSRMTNDLKLTPDQAQQFGAISGRHALENSRRSRRRRQPTR